MTEDLPKPIRPSEEVSHYIPPSPRLDALKEVLRNFMSDRGLISKDILDENDAETDATLPDLMRTMEDAGLDVDSLDLLEAVVGFQEEGGEDGDEGGANVREPRRPRPDTDSDAMALEVEPDLVSS